MPKVFELPDVRNHAPRNGFDLSQRHLFTASAGQIIPIFAQMCVPSDHFKINTSIFTRTDTMKSANFARFKEYVDFFFVPLRSIWRYSDEFLTDIENDKSAFSFSNTANRRFKNAPCIDVHELLECFNVTQAETDVDALSVNWQRGANKIADMLGYGEKFFAAMDSADVMDLDTQSCGYVNIWRLAAYQAIYQNFYRNTQWESADPTTFNFDYLNSSGEAISANKLPYNDHHVQDFTETTAYKLFQMRYADYPKDLFNGLLPSTQFGEVSLVSTVMNNTKITGLNGNVPENGAVYTLSGEAWNKSSPTTTGAERLSLINEISILDLRRAEALQRWKEIHMIAKKTYKDQVNRMYGFNVPDYYDDVVNYLGGFTNLVNVQDVTATAGTETDSLGDLAGKGIGASTGQEINFEAKYHGILMACYHVLPIPEYNASMVDKQNSIISNEDYYNPLFGNIGLESVRRLELARINDSNVQLPSGNFNRYNNNALGYTSRYIEYKTALDKCHGRFCLGHDLSYWTLPIDLLKKMIITNNDDPDNPGSMLDFSVDYRSFKCVPSDTDGVFVAQQESINPNDDSADPFKIVASFDIKAIRPMDVDGMPY